MHAHLATEFVGFTALLQLSDSALPTGAFSHSFGLESYLQAGECSSEHELLDWLREYLEFQLVPSDAVAVRLVCAAGSIARVTEIDLEVGALIVPRQVHEASTRMGRRLLEIARQSFDCPWVQSYADDVDQGKCEGHYAVAYAVVGCGQGFDVEILVEAYLYSALASLVTNAVRAIPLGQLAGQRVLAALRQELPGAVARSALVDETAFGAAAPALEIHQIRHEHLHARMFAS